MEGSLHPANILMCPETCVTNLPQPRQKHPGENQLLLHYAWQALSVCLKLELFVKEKSRDCVTSKVIGIHTVENAALCGKQNYKHCMWEVKVARAIVFRQNTGAALQTNIQGLRDRWNTALCDRMNTSCHILEVNSAADHKDFAV